MRRASALAERDAEAALALPEPELGPLRRSPMPQSCERSSSRRRRERTASRGDLSTLAERSTSSSAAGCWTQTRRRAPPSCANTCPTDIRRQFVLERIDGPRGDWWRGLLHESVCHSHPHGWLAPSSRLAVIPVHAERWLLLVEIQLDTGVTQGALLVRLPRALTTAPDVTLRDTKLTLVTGDADVGVIDIATAQIEAWESGHAPPDRIVEQCWMSSNPRRLWLALRRRGNDIDDETWRLYDRQSRHIVAEFGDQLNATPVLGHPEADVVVHHHARPTVVDASGRPLAWRPPTAAPARRCTRASRAPRRERRLRRHGSHHSA